MDRKAKYPELEKELAEWILENRRKSNVITRYMIIIKAKDLAKRLSYQMLYSDLDSFQFSLKWLEGFMRRYNFSNRRQTSVAQHFTR